MPANGRRDLIRRLNVKVVTKHVNLLLLHMLSKFGPSFILVDGFRNNIPMFGRLDVVTLVLMKIQFKYFGL